MDKYNIGIDYGNENSCGAICIFNVTKNEIHKIYNLNSFWAKLKFKLDVFWFVFVYKAKIYEENKK